MKDNTLVHIIWLIYTTNWMLNSPFLLPNLLPQNVYTQDVGEDQMAFDEFGFRLPGSVANSHYNCLQIHILHHIEFY